MLVFFVGLMIGTLCFVSLSRWAGLFVFARHQLALLGAPVPPSRVVRLVLCESLFHSGPWLLATVTFFAYEIRGEAWARPFLLGLVVGVAYMSVLVFRVWKSVGHGIPTENRGL